MSIQPATSPMQLHFVLIEPARPANVGAAARALKTMGFSSLRIVAPTDSESARVHLDREAGWVAHGADEILEQVQLFPSLSEATADCGLVIGTTARERGSKQRYFSPEQLSEQLTDRAGTVSQVALVFGRESSGLHNSELAQCDVLSYIPLAVSYPSLNLAQAVMLYSYALSGLNQRLSLGTAAAIVTGSEASEAGQLRVLKQRVASLLDRLELDENDKLYQWSQQRLGLLSTRDLHMLHTLCGDLERKLN